MRDVIDENALNYKDLLKDYIKTQDENALYRAELVSKSFIKRNILPEEIINLHNQALKELYPKQYEELKHSMSFLLETMISYGLAHQEFQTLREEQFKLKSEISVAASMQETLLATSKPDISGLDIGAISVPAEQMNGDYHHFVKDRDGTLGVAIADVIGKGVPAALCMSMIKYAMESFPGQSMSPQSILGSLNRVVEKNVDPGIFITMFYGHYSPATGKFQYASAGHEPGYHFDAKKNQFTEIKTKGLVLGVLPDSTYSDYECQLGKNDMIILLTDGVTECRTNGEFIEVSAILEVIKEYAHLTAQELVNHVYRHFERLQNFHLRDDFTLIIIKKVD